MATTVSPVGGREQRLLAGVLDAARAEHAVGHVETVELRLYRRHHVARPSARCGGIQKQR